MGKKQMMKVKIALMAALMMAGASAMLAQNVQRIEFCDKKYEYVTGKDDITLYFRIIDGDRKRNAEIAESELQNYLVVKEDGAIIPAANAKIEALKSGERIPADYTFSVLVDKSIADDGKEKIFEAVGHLVQSAPQGCVYLSFFGDEVTNSVPVTADNYQQMKEELMKTATNKFFYGAIYSKLAEFNAKDAELEKEAKLQAGYQKNKDIAQRAQLNQDKNVLFVFTDSRVRPHDENIGFIEVTDFQNDKHNIMPKVFALYYTGNGEDPNVKAILQGISQVRDSTGTVVAERSGAYRPSDNMNTVMSEFEQAVKDAMYDYAFTYKATDGRVYNGRVGYEAEWKGSKVGEGEFSIGSAENPWPAQEETGSDTAMKYVIALLVALLTMLFFFLVMKVLIPWIKSKAFNAKYYKKYVPEANVNRRICHFCKQDIQPGQLVVTKCRHIMHVGCWKSNGYKCAEYGQNCKEGIQDHVEWKSLFSAASLRDCYQTFAGIFAGLISWVVFELTGRGLFKPLAEIIVKAGFTNDEQYSNLFGDCVNKTSAFLSIGLLLGFFLSLIFRYFDEYRNKNAMIYLKIVGLSLLSAVIGMLAFALGAFIFCVLLSAVNTTYIPWYCSLPAYLLFSVCLSLSLTIKSTIPMKSALLGGLVSAVIGFVVLYFSSVSGSKYGWLNMLLDFIIYGGGLGASLVTVRLLAEKFFLVIQNGIKANQRIPIHKWMKVGNKVSIGMTGECEIQMNWEKSNKVAKEHVQLFVDTAKQLPMIKSLAPGVLYNSRFELAVGKPAILSNGDTFTVGDTIFKYEEN